jgi:hypothetical protein
MEEKETPIEKLFVKAEEYTQTTIELVKLKAIDKTADFFAFVMVRLALFIVVSLFFLIVNIGIAMWAGELLGKTYYGFFIVAGFYILIGILLYSFRNSLIKIPISNSIISQLIKNRVL